MDLNKLYKEIEEAEVNLNAKRLKYIKEALTENGGSVKLKFKEFKEWQEANNVFDFDDQFPVIIEIDGNSWEGNLFIRTITDDQDGETKYECLNGVVFVHCIPFEGNECLLGITENPEKK